MLLSIIPVVAVVKIPAPRKLVLLEMRFLLILISGQTKAAIPAPVLIAVLFKI